MVPTYSVHTLRKDAEATRFNGKGPLPPLPPLPHYRTLRLGRVDIGAEWYRRVCFSPIYYVLYTPTAVWYRTPSSFVPEGPL